MKSTGVLIGAALLAALVGCTAKPSQDACDKAVQNIRRLTGDTHTEAGSEQRAAIRSCQAQSSRETAECYMRAQTKEELYTCGGELADSLRAAAQESAKVRGASDAPAPAPAPGSAPAPAGSGAPPPSPAPGAAGSGTNP